MAYRRKAITSREQGRWLRCWALHGMGVRDISKRFGRSIAVISAYLQEVAGVEDLNLCKFEGEIPETKE